MESVYPTGREEGKGSNLSERSEHIYAREILQSAANFESLDPATNFEFATNMFNKR